MTDEGYFEDDGDDAGALEDDIKKGALVNLQNLKRADGIITMGKAQTSLLQRVITAPQHSKEYRQILLLLDFMSSDEADRFSGAISFSLRYGIPIDPIIDKALSRCSVKANRVEAVIRALTHINFSNNNQDRKRNDRQSTRKSPLSQ